jgi:hypothetical protein
MRVLLCLSWRAIASLKNVFHSQMLVGEFLNILDLKINILLQMVSCLQFLHFSSKAS